MHGVRTVAVAGPGPRPLRRALPGVDVLAGPDAATELTATTPAHPCSTASPARAAWARRWPHSLRARRSRWPTRSRSSRAAAGDRRRAARTDRARRLRALRDRPVPAGRTPRRGRTAGAHRVRRPVPRPSARDELAEVTIEQALAHPTWDMGPVVTINSATLVNKGLEVIEAHLLFDVPYDRIDVVVHPQSVVHSMVTFVDGSTIAQASPPDMRLPIALALAGRTASRAPRRLPLGRRAGLDLRAARPRRLARGSAARWAGRPAVRPRRVQRRERGGRRRLRRRRLPYGHHGRRRGHPRGSRGLGPTDPLPCVAGRRGVGRAPRTERVASAALNGRRRLLARFG